MKTDHALTDKVKKQMERGWYFLVVDSSLTYALVSDKLSI